jgi:hypothetical protein
MSGTPEFFKSVQRFAVGVVLFAAGVAAVIIAWWIAVMALLGLGIWLGVRRWLGRDQPRADATVIEGEFERVDDPNRRLR